ncbi:hypothetical protein DEO72_LG5g528 [Vigna unguiculata]|uniref:Uncharacterized protein n=1 Tax=Vigna unguiculata TaxID=3917 RepID=A0A4D6LX58_VIGUN|nr:hypothetical protein DEO72_LG5g528 [Vigna unguiculata]
MVRNLDLEVENHTNHAQEDVPPKPITRECCNIVNHESRFASPPHAATKRASEPQIATPKCKLIISMWTISFPQHHPICPSHPYSTAFETCHRQHESPSIATFTMSVWSSFLGVETLIRRGHKHQPLGLRPFAIVPRSNFLNTAPFFSAPTTTRGEVSILRRHPCMIVFSHTLVN